MVKLTKFGKDITALDYSKVMDTIKLARQGEQEVEKETIS